MRRCGQWEEAEIKRGCAFHSLTTCTAAPSLPGAYYRCAIYHAAQPVLPRLLRSIGARSRTVLLGQNDRGGHGRREGGPAQASPGASHTATTLPLLCLHICLALPCNSSLAATSGLPTHCPRLLGGQQRLERGVTRAWNRICCRVLPIIRASLSHVPRGRALPFISSLYLRHTTLFLARLRAYRGGYGSHTILKRGLPTFARFNHLHTVTFDAIRSACAGGCGARAVCACSHCLRGSNGGNGTARERLAFSARGGNARHSLPPLSALPFLYASKRRPIASTYRLHLPPVTGSLHCACHATPRTTLAGTTCTTTTHCTHLPLYFCDLYLSSSDTALPHHSVPSGGGRWLGGWPRVQWWANTACWWRRRLQDNGALARQRAARSTTGCRARRQ